VSQKRVNPGDPLRISAATWNGVLAMMGGRTAPGVSGSNSGSGLGPGEVWICNTSGADRSWSDVLGISGPAFDPGDEDQLAEFCYGDLSVIGATPSEPGNLGRFAVLLEPIAEGKIGRGLVSGIVPAWLDVADAANADFADIRDGDAASLSTGPTGSAYVLWRAGGTGEQWGIVLLGPPANPAEVITASEYMIHQLRTTGGVTAPVWDWARMHE
jgi:hypothetical protein